MKFPWEADIPSRWDQIPLKYLTISTTGGTPDKSNSQFWGGDIPWVSSKDMDTTSISDTEDYISQNAIEQGEAKLVPEGTLLIVSRSGILEHSIPVAVTDTEVAINQDIRAYIPTNKRISGEFLRDFIIGFEDELLQIWRQQGATVQSLNSEAVSQTPFPVPDRSQERQIVSYSKTVTSLILDAKQHIEEMILLLKERKKSAISYHVAGSEKVDWKKDIHQFIRSELPNEWDRAKLRWVTNKIGSGSTPDGGSEAYVEEGIKFIRSQNVTEMGLQLADIVYIDQKTHQEMNSTQVHAKDVLLNITGASLGRTSVVPNEITSANVNQHVCIIRPIQQHIVPEYLNYVLESVIGQRQIFANQTGASREAVTFSQIGDFEVPLPPISEQKRIIQQVDSMVTNIHTSINHLKAISELLEEKRQALITAAVTGQIDVSKEKGVIQGDD